MSERPWRYAPFALGLLFASAGCRSDGSTSNAGTGGLPSLGTSAAVHRTSRTENLVSMDAVPIANGSFVATIAPYSITSFVIAMP